MADAREILIIAYRFRPGTKSPWNSSHKNISFKIFLNKNLLLSGSKALQPHREYSNAFIITEYWLFIQFIYKSNEPHPHRPLNPQIRPRTLNLHLQPRTWEYSKLEPGMRGIQPVHTPSRPARWMILLHVAAYIRSYTDLFFILALIDLIDQLSKNEGPLRAGPIGLTGGGVRAGEVLRERR